MIGTSHSSFLRDLHSLRARAEPSGSNVGSSPPGCICSHHNDGAEGTVVGGRLSAKSMQKLAAKGVAVTSVSCPPSRTLGPDGEGGLAPPRRQRQYRHRTERRRRRQLRGRLHGRRLTARLHPCFICVLQSPDQEEYRQKNGPPNEAIAKAPRRPAPADTSSSASRRTPRTASGASRLLRR